MGIIKAPFSQVQVYFLNRFQEAGRFHPFTCGGEKCRENLVATTDGWRCPLCDYTQDWAYAIMAKPMPPDRMEQSRRIRERGRLTAIESRLTALERGKVIRTDDWGTE
jgi:hypothetical protein